MFFLLQKGKSTIYMLLMVSNTQMPGLHIIYTISYIIAYELRQSIWMVNCLGFCHFTELMSSSEWLHRFQEPTSYPLLERWVYVSHTSSKQFHYQPIYRQHRLSTACNPVIISKGYGNSYNGVVLLFIK